MNLKFNLNTVNTILMVVVLILVIVACVKKSRENFQDSVCYIPCNDGKEGEWTDGAETQFSCGGPECADVSTIDAATGRGAEFGLKGPMIDTDVLGPARGLAGILHNIFIGALDADVWGKIEGGANLWEGDVHVKTGLNKTASSGKEEVIIANIKILIDEIKKSDGFLDEIYILINEGEDNEKYKTLDKQAKINFRVALGIDGYCGENTEKSFCVNLY
jgi:hypothetical protein